MKLPCAQIEKACGVKDSSRPYLKAPYLDIREGEAPRLIATDGKIMAIHTVELDEGDTSGPIGVDAIKVARKTPGACVLANGSLQVPLAGQTFTREDNGTFPEWRRVDETAPKADGQPDICLSAELLLNLVKALGVNRYNGAALWFARNPDGSIDSNSAVRVKATGSEATGSEATGIIMPMRY